MDAKLRYVPPIKTSFIVIVFISFFPVLLALFLLFNKFGILSILIFTVFYAIFMVLIFLLLSQSYYLQIFEEENKMLVRKGFKKIELDISRIGQIDLAESKRSFILEVLTKEKTKRFSLSGSLSFEEPPFVPFLRKIEQLKPTVVMGDYCQGILHGESAFNPWSSKMYFAYYTYIVMMIAYYLLLLLGILILK
jgi:hypothetical protein